MILRLRKGVDVGCESFYKEKTYILSSLTNGFSRYIFVTSTTKIGFVASEMYLLPHPFINNITLLYGSWGSKTVWSCGGLGVLGFAGLGF